MLVCVSGVSENTIDQLQRYFDNVVPHVIMSTLKTENSITQDCMWYQFTDCRSATPQRLTVDAQLSYSDSVIDFYNADAEVHISDVTITGNGQFNSLVYNFWNNKKYDAERRSGHYSLLPYVKTLTIKDNPQALLDLESYLTGRYEIKGNKIRIQQLGADMRIKVYNPGNSLSAIKTLANYFTTVLINDQDVREYISIEEDLLERQKMLYRAHSYELVKQLGAGTYGVAHLATYREDGSQCVIKKIDLGKLSPDKQKTAQNEVEALSKCDHPNVVRYRNGFRENDNLYITMEYCDQGTLQELLAAQKEKGQFSEDEVFHYFVQLCLALRHVHDRHILHRDLAPKNVFLATPTEPGIKGPRVKLGDFGVSRVMQSPGQRAMTIIGTKRYMAPEVLNKQLYDNKSDIWSLGCILYELCTFQPLVGESSLEILLEDGSMPFVPSVPDKYSQEVQDIINVTLRTDPDERYSVRQIMELDQIKRHVPGLLTEEELRRDAAAPLQSLWSAEEQPLLPSHDSVNSRHSAQPAQSQQLLQWSSLSRDHAARPDEGLDDDISSNATSFQRFGGEFPDQLG